MTTTKYNSTSFYLLLLLGLDLELDFVAAFFFLAIFIISQMNLGTNAYKIVLLNWILRNAKSLAIQVFACSLLVALPVLHEPQA